MPVLSRLLNIGKKFISKYQLVVLKWAHSSTINVKPIKPMFYLVSPRLTCSYTCRVYLQLR